MTALSNLLTDAKNGGRNVDHWVEQARAAGHRINRATVYKYLDGDHAKNPSEKTLEALAFVFALDVRDLRQAVNKPRGELGAWTPTEEASRLNEEQRAALNLLIKTIVRGGAEDADGPAANQDPDVGPGNQPTGGKPDNTPPGTLSVVPPITDDAVAALEEEGSTVGEQTESDDA